MKPIRSLTVVVALCGVLCGSSYAAPSKLSTGVGATSKPDPVADPIQEELRATFARLQSYFRQQVAALEVRIAAALSPEMEDTLASWHLGNDPVAPMARIARELERVAVGSGLDFLTIVTEEGEVFSSLAEKLPARAESDLVALARDAFRDGSAAFGVVPFESLHLSGVGATDGGQGELHAVSVVAVPFSPEFPPIALVGGQRLLPFVGDITTALGWETSEFRWHLFQWGDDGAEVIAGVGKGRALTTLLLTDLSRSEGEPSEEPAFEDESSEGFGDPRVRRGRWTTFSSHDGTRHAGWGVTVDPTLVKEFLAEAAERAAAERAAAERVAAERAAAAKLAAAAEIGIPESRTPAPPGRRTLRDATTVAAATPSWWSQADPLVISLFCLLLTAVVAGFLWLLLTLRTSGRRRRDRLEALKLPTPKTGPAFPASPDTGNESLVTQFEINWKTFASYTQDLLDDRLSEIEQAPQKGFNALKASVEELTERFSTLRDDLSGTQKEVRAASTGLLERVGTLLDEAETGRTGLSVETEEMVSRIEEDLGETRERFGELDSTVVELAEIYGARQEEIFAERLAEEEEKIREEWTHRVEDVEAEREAIADDLAEALEVEGKLRGLLDEGAKREEALEAAVEHERRNVEAVQSERDMAWDRERSVRDDLCAAEKREEEAHQRISQFEDDLRAADIRMQEQREREQDLLRELEESRELEEKAQDSIKEGYRQQGRLKKALERQEAESGQECERLNREIAELAAAKSALEESLASRAKEIETLREIAEDKVRDLKALRNDFQSLNEQKEQLDKELREATERGRVDQEEIARVRNGLHQQGEELRQKVEEKEAQDQHVQHLESTLNAKNGELAEAHAAQESLRGELDETRASSGAVEERLTSEKADFERKWHESRAGAVRLEETLRETEARLREADQEKTRCQERLSEVESEWHARLADVETRLGRADSGRDETERALVEAQDANARLRVELEAATRLSAHAGDTDPEESRALEKENEKLARNLEHLSADLTNARREAERTKGFQDALVDGGLPVALVAVDPSLKVFAWNSEAVALWERKERQVLHRPLGELGLGGVDAEIVRALERVVRTGKPASLTEVAFPSANETKHVRLRASAIVGPSGQVLGALLTAEDVTKQTEVQIDARLQSLFSESLVRSLPAALLVADSRDRIISWNRNAEEILGVDESDALGRDLFELDTPLSRGAFKKRFLKHKRTGDPSRVRVRLEAAGEPAQFVVTQCPFLGENDTVRGTILMLQEVYQNVEA